MYSPLLERTSKSIDALRRHLGTSDALRSAIHEGAFSCKKEASCFPRELLLASSAPDRVEWRIIDHCATVTRIYAIYEQFAHEMIREHLALLQRFAKFDRLPEEVQNGYRRGLSIILEKKDGPRYGHLNLQGLIEQYSLALTAKSYSLEPLAMLIHEQNLRLPELGRIFANSGIPKMESWVEKNRSIRNFFEAGSRIGATAEGELSELIKYRNDAAHGSINVDDLLGLDFLYEFCDFTQALCSALAERVQLVGLEFLLTNGAASDHGKVTELFMDGRVVIANTSGTWAVGDKVYVCGDDYCWEREVTSLQLDDENIDGLSLTITSELGIGLSAPAKKNCRLVSLKKPRIGTASAAAGATAAASIAAAPASAAAAATEM